MPYLSDYHYKDDVDAVFFNSHGTRYARDKFVVGYFNGRLRRPSPRNYVRSVWSHELSSTTGKSKCFVKTSLRTEAMEVVYSNSSTNNIRSMDYQKSVFCLNPPGDSWIRKGTYDSLVYGCIPVFSHAESFNKPYYCKEGEVDHIGVLVDDKKPLLPQLLQIPPEKVRQMQLNIARLGRSLQFSELTFVRQKYDLRGLLELDAFEVAMSTMFKLAESHANHTFGLSENGLYRPVPKPQAAGFDMCTEPKDISS